MKKRMVFLISLMVALGGCRAVLDDNPPSSEDINPATDEQNNSVENQSNGGAYFLNGRDPYLYAGTTLNGTPITVIGGREPDGNVGSIEQVRFGAPGYERTLNLYEGRVSYELTETLTIDVLPSEDGAIARVTDTEASSLRSFWVSTDSTFIQPQVSGTNEATSIYAPTTMAAYAQSTGLFVASPTACGKPVTDNAGTQLSLTLTQDGFERHYPLRLDNDSVWRSSVPMPGHGTEAIADEAKFPGTFREEVGRWCTGMVTAKPDNQNNNSLIMAAKNLVRISPENSVSMLQFEQDIEAFCQLAESGTESEKSITEMGINWNQPIQALLTLKQGLKGKTSVEAWLTEASEVSVQHEIQASDEALMIGIDYNQNPLYVGDDYSVAVITQCSDSKEITVTAYDGNDSPIAMDQRYLQPSNTAYVTTDFGSLFNVEVEDRYSVSVTLNENGQSVSEWEIKPTLR